MFKQITGKLLERNNWLLIGLLVLSAILRLWKFYDLPLMHDELSALTRLEYDSFSEFIHNGIRLDGHPAGVQMYLYFFTNLFGYGTLLLKLPFIFIGVFSVYLIYKIGCKWYSRTAGLIAASFFVGIQYTIIYSMIIRPYGPGLFVSLLLVNYWTNIFLLGQKNWKNFIVYGVLLAACGYTHYFTLLFGAVVSITGLPFLRKDTLIKYLVSGGLAIVLFLPHFEIFFYQLNVGGIGAGQGGWLKAPTLEFIPSYLSYVFNYSIIAQGIALGVLLLSLFSSLRSAEKLYKKLILLVWFIAPLAIGYWYSVEVNPVLQYSVLLFSTPFVFLFIASFEEEWKLSKVALIVIVITGVSVFSLQSERKHFTHFFNQPVNTYYDLVEEFDSDSTLLIGSHENVFVEHYDRLSGVNRTYYTTDEDCTSVANLQLLLGNPKYNRVVVGTMFAKEVGMATSYFPKVNRFQEGVTLENLVLSRSNLKIDSSLYYYDLAFGSSSWPNTNKKIIQDSGSFVMKGKWGVKTSFALDSVLNSPYDIVEFYGDFDVESEEPYEVMLVMEFYKDGEKIKWTGANSKDMAYQTDKDFVLVNGQQFLESDTKVPDSVVAYVGNKNKSELKIHSLGVRIRKGNPNKYALYNRFKD